VRIHNRKVLQGVVHSDKMDKTITVDVTRRFRHPKYGKFIVSTKRYMAHDAKGDARIGDRVEIAETRPLSKRKCWRLIQVLGRAHSKESTR